jgi:hypothetical protein
MHVTDVATDERAATDYDNLVEGGYNWGLAILRCKDGDELRMRYVAGETEFDGAPAFMAVGWLEPGRAARPDEEGRTAKLS